MVGLNGNGQGVNYQMGSFTLNNVNFPTSVNANISDWMRVFSSFSVNGIKASLAQLPVFALDNYGGTISPPGDSGNIVVKTNLDGLMTLGQQTNEYSKKLEKCNIGKWQIILPTQRTNQYFYCGQFIKTATDPLFNCVHVSFCAPFPPRLRSCVHTDL